MGDIWEARREAGVDVWRESEPEAGCVFDGLLVGEAPGTAVESRAIVASGGSHGACCVVALVEEWREVAS